MRRCILTMAAMAASLPGSARGDARTAEIAAGGSALLDVDGDGRAETVALTATELVIEGDAGRQAFAAPAAQRARVAVAAGHLAVEIDLAGGDALGIAADRRGGGWREVWRGPVGAAGPDGEYALHLEATDDGLFRYQARSDIRRCDGRPARLFRERIRGGGRFEAVASPVDVAPDAPTIVASREVAVATPPAPIFRPSRASSSADADHALELRPPVELGDLDLASEWTVASPRAARGELVTFRSRIAGQKAHGLYISWRRAGHRARPTRLAVVSETTALWIDLPRGGSGGLWAAFPAPIASECVTVIIADADRKAAATGIGELAILSELDLAPGGVDAGLVGLVITGGLPAVTAAKILGERRAASPIVDALATPKLEEGARRRLRGALAATGMPQATPVLIEQLAEATAEPERVEAAQGLRRIQPLPVAELGALLANPKARPEGRAAAAAVLGDSSDPAATQALLAAAGLRPRLVRRVVIAALSTRPVADLTAAAKAATTDDARADLWKAATVAAARAGGADQHAFASALLAELGATTRYEILYRLVDAIAALGDDATIKALAAWLDRLGDTARHAGLRQVAAAALARNPAGGAEVALTGLLANRDPGVRLAAVSSLDGRPPRAAAAEPWVSRSADAQQRAIDRALISLLTGDKWTEVRVASARALGARCRWAVTQALGASLDGDGDPEVQVTALSSLAGCRPEGIEARLLAMADDGVRAPPVRLRAIDLLASFPAANPGLVERFTRWRSQALSDGDALLLAMRAAMALGRAGGTAAEAALRDAALDDSFPDLAAAAAAGLGELPRCSREVTGLLERLERSPERPIALAARRSIGRCRGKVPANPGT